jgi:pimeloyl-ACP methyl ester carboxylesterase
MTYLTRDGVQIYFEADGSGPAVLLTHGFACTGKMWEAQLRERRGDCRLITWDVRGHDRSSAPEDPGAYSREHYTDDMVAILDACGVDRALLVGHSMGCVLSVHFALSHEERTAGLLLLGGAGGPITSTGAVLAGWNDGVAQLAQAFVDHGLTPNDAEIGQLTPGGMLAAPECRLANHRSASALAYALVGALTFTDPLETERLTSSGLPVEVVLGAHEHDFIVRAADELLAGIPAARKTIIEEAGHAANLDAPQEFNRILLRAASQATYSR